ncbi:hypothetical protein PtB15_11B111 [Puccinia triticina]|nr:hypothetical protein PtB15_11B111 [Puccinia triticina]
MSMSISQLDPSLLESPSGIHQSPNLSDLHIDSDYSTPEPASGKPKQARRTKAEMILYRAQLAQTKAEEERLKTLKSAEKLKGQRGKKKNTGGRAHNSRPASQRST